MLLWTTLGLFLVGILTFQIGKRIKRLRRIGVDSAGAGMTTIFGFVLALMLLTIACDHLGIRGDYAEKKQHRDFLVAQYKTEMYNGSVYSQYNLLQQIDEYNSKLAKMQDQNHDYWIGVFVPDYWDDLEYITVNLFGDVTGGGDKE